MKKIASFLATCLLIFVCLSVHAMDNDRQFRGHKNNLVQKKFKPQKLHRSKEKYIPKKISRARPIKSNKCLAQPLTSPSSFSDKGIYRQEKPNDVQECTGRQAHRFIDEIKRDIEKITEYIYEIFPTTYIGNNITVQIKLSAGTLLLHYEWVDAEGYEFTEATFRCD